MSAKTPIITPLGGPYVLVQGLLAAVMVAIFGALLVTGDLRWLLVFGLYYAYAFLGPFLLLRKHREGSRLIKRGLFADAITAFEASYSFLNKHSWIDKYRFVTVPSASAISYREAALCNIGYCFLRLENTEAALQAYSRAKEKFPESEPAKSALAYIDSQETV